MTARTLPLVLIAVVAFAAYFHPPPRFFIFVALGVAIVLLFRLWLWSFRHYPYVAWFILGFLRFFVYRGGRRW